MLCFDDDSFKPELPYEDFKAIADKLCELSLLEFMSVYGTIMDAYAAAHNEDAHEVLFTILKASDAINKEFGKLDSWAAE